MNMKHYIVCLLALAFTIWKYTVIANGLSWYMEPRVKLDFDYQHFMNNADVTGNKANLPPKYDVVYPYLSDKRGKRIGPLKQCQLSVNRKPNMVKKQRLTTSNRFYAAIKLPTEKLVLKLRLNKKLTLNRPQVDFFDESGKPQRTFISDSCHYIGKVVNKKNSTVSLSNGHGLLTGLIRTSTTDYFIEPMPEKQLFGRVPHIIYKVETALAWKNFSTSDDILPRNTKTRIKRETKSYDSYNDHLINDSARLYLETLVAVDDAVVKFHGSNSSAVEYIMTIMNIVNVIYEDASLNANLQIVVSKILFVNEFNTTAIRWDNKSGLENVCKLSPVYTDEDDSDVDIKIYLTRDDIGGVAGFAPLNAICDRTNSCLVIRDEGLTSAFILAHEIAHVLGLSHDGDKDNGNYCSLDKNQHSIMAPTVQSNFNRYYWSSCSINEFHTQRKVWFCMQNKPKRNDKTKIAIPKLLHATLYDLDEQCRQEFGEGYRHCKQYKNMDPCQILWCTTATKKTVCLTKQKSPLNGTPCNSNKDKCCKNGQCVGTCKRKHPLKPIYQNPLHGKWGDWSSYGTCSRKCGGGVRFRSRKCDNPAPFHGGRYCKGPHEEFQLCNLNKCPETKDYRDEQCKMYAKYHSSNYLKNTWTPTPTNGSSRDCKLSCISTKENKTFIGENVKDGTLCSYDGSHNICVQGTCQHVGCDGVLNSTAQMNSCGICNKNNSHCKVTEKIYSKIPTKRFTRVAVVPRHARHLMIRKAAGAPNFVVLQSRRLRQFVLNGNKGQGTSKMFVAAGTLFNYTVDNGTEIITAPGPILEELLVLISVKRWKTSVKIFTNYTMPKNTSLDSLVNPEEYFFWKEIGWSSCSNICGGGIQILKTECIDKRFSKLTRVSKRHCSLLNKPAIRKRKCNTFPCVYKWIPDKWEHCSQTCGSNGIQNREVKCFHVLGETKTLKIPSYCSASEKPHDKQSCNNVACPGRWETSSWSQCSVTCGNGTRTRSTTCVPPENESYYACGDEPPKIEVCEEPPCPVCIDKSSTCSDLQIYCSMEGFMDTCCKTCTDKMMLKNSK